MKPGENWQPPFSQILTIAGNGSTRRRQATGDRVAHDANAGLNPEMVAMQKVPDAGMAEMMKGTPMSVSNKAVVPDASQFAKRMQAMGAMMRNDYGCLSSPTPCFRRKRWNCRISGVAVDYSSSTRDSINL
ncbi:hypothetical protein [Sinorhizobium sp. A49]|uniref:hypothetical protein n=1 Tax=Sinorhizobium sp. A49 TaxID=1945861 RepID=UPI001115A897|nr:hypothetical protein [Sinorhizobium sp. A49]